MLSHEFKDLCDPEELKLSNLEYSEKSEILKNPTQQTLNVNFLVFPVKMSRTIDLSSTKHSRVSAVFDLILIDRFEMGDQLKFKLGNEERILESDEVLDHTLNIAGLSFRDRLVRVNFDSAHELDSLEISITFSKGN